MRVYIVQQGDTLWKISKQQQVDFERLKQLNSHLANPDLLMPGMEIFLPDEDCKKDGEMQQPLPFPHQMPQMPMHPPMHQMEPMFPCFICQMMPMHPMQSMPWGWPQMPTPQPFPQQMMPQQSNWPTAGCGGDPAVDRQYYEQIRALEQQMMPMHPPQATPYW